MKHFRTKLPAQLLALTLLLGLVAPLHNAMARPDYQKQFDRMEYRVQEQRKGLTAREAAARAKAMYGGKVLKVKRVGENAFRVRLLQDSGRVINVVIRG